MKLYVACTNAIYLRTNLCDWGYNGTRFNNDMKIIEEITLAEVEMYRTVTFDDITEDMKRLNGLGYAKKKNNKNEEGIIHWTRGTSVHPHMMLGYPLSNDNAILKRYVSESQASLDELRARVYDDGVVLWRDLWIYRIVFWRCVTNLLRNICNINNNRISSFQRTMMFLQVLRHDQ